MTDKPNLSTEHQPEGAAGNPSDTLGKTPHDKKPIDDTREDPAFAKNGE